MNRLKRHVSLVLKCRQYGHPSFEPKRRVFLVGGQEVSYLVCTRCGSGVEPQKIGA